MTDAGFDERIAGVASLAEPQRRALYRFVVGRRRPIGKDEAAAAMGVARSVAAFHLDRLVADGLLVAEYRRLTGRQGPGAGRPAKLYRRADSEVTVSLPARQYQLAASLLAAAVSESAHTGVPVTDVLARVAAGRGRALGERALQAAGARPDDRALVGAAMQTLEEEGYEPHEDGGEIVLANCPFHALAEDERELVCGMNHDLLGGMAAAVGDAVLRARLAPSAGNCCVRLDLGPPAAKDR